MDALHLSGCNPNFSSVNAPHEAGSSRILRFGTINMAENTPAAQEQHQPLKKTRNTPGSHDPDAEVVALTPETLLAVNEYVCELCKRSFLREQNLQLHMKSHKFNVVLKKNSSRNDDKNKKVYVCPDENCRHHHRSKALGGLTGIKKHYQRKHGFKNFKCTKCGKEYGVQSDLKAHSKVCGTKDYVCMCGMHFNRRCLFYTHKVLCRMLQRERLSMASMTPPNIIASNAMHAPLFPTEALALPPPPPPQGEAEMTNYTIVEASMIGVTPFGEMMGVAPFGFPMSQLQYVGGVGIAATFPNDNYYLMSEQSNPDEQLTRDFLGLSAGNNGGGVVVRGSFGVGSSSNNVGGFGF